MTYRSLLLVAGTVLACMTAATAAPTPSPAAPALMLVPSRQGASSVFGYQVDANGPRGSQYAHGAIVPATLSLSAHAAQHDAERTISADGTGTITIAQQSAQGGGFSRGGGRGGGFPGGGGMGGGRRGGGGGDEAGPAQRVPATEVLHVEASFRGASFLGARGTEQTTPTQGDKTPNSTSWSLFPY